MATLTAKKLGRALEKAKQVGRAEVDFTLDGMKLVLTNLVSDQYVEIQADVGELDDLEYLTEWRKAHLCRALVEVDGVDLRDADYISDDVEENGEVKTVRFQRHVWVNQNFVASLTKEAVDVMFRKFAEVVGLAEKKAAAGVTFSIESESDEDKFRRLLGEALEAGSEVPGEIVMRTFEELGLTRKVTEKEAETANERLARLAKEETPEVRVYHSSEPAPTPPSTAPAAQPAPQIARRQPLNRVTPVLSEAPPAATQPAQQPVPIPVQQPVQPKGRAAEFAAIEGEFDTGVAPSAPEGLSGATSAATPEQLQRLRNHVRQQAPTPVMPDEAVTVQPQQTDPRGVQSILDQPPTVGINPRFRPPSRL